MVTGLDKALAAAIMAMLSIFEIVYGWNLGVSQETVEVILLILIPIVVYLVPNRET